MTWFHVSLEEVKSRVPNCRAVDHVEHHTFQIWKRKIVEDGAVLVKEEWWRDPLVKKQVGKRWLAKGWSGEVDGWL
jgi:hypothetical protein